MRPSDAYYDRIREMKNPFNHRLRLVDYAHEHSLKAMARKKRHPVVQAATYEHRWTPDGHYHGRDI
jgi:hypothetical protein